MLRKIPMIYIATVLMMWPYFGFAATLFEEVTNTAGIEHQANSFGISWGDANNDGYPDVFLSNHFTNPSLFLNLGNGTFSDVSLSHDLSKGGKDQHAAAWADYDNDGDKDLLIVSGGALIGDTCLLKNSNDYKLEFQDPMQTGLNWGWSDRTPTWFDDNQDGYLDVLISNLAKNRLGAEPPLFRQLLDGTFQVVHNFPSSGGAWAGMIIAGATSTPQNPGILFSRGDFFSKIDGLWTETTSLVFPPDIIPRGRDYAYGDVNNDGYMDFYLMREGILAQVILNANSLDASYRSNIDELSGYNFKANGEITVYFGLSITHQQFKLGENQIGITAMEDSYAPIVLNSSSPDVVGEPTIVIDGNSVWVWYTPSDGYWHFRFGSDKRSQNIEIHINTDVEIQDLTIHNIEVKLKGARNFLYMSDSLGGFFPDDRLSGLSILNPSRSGVFADFDNDMDLDLYMVNRGAAGNSPNQLFLNNGLGIFTEEPLAAGAPGSDIGIGDAVAIADYDLDGFIDIFLTNGRTDLRMDYPGPNQLYRNLGNENHWLEIDLIGIQSNRDGVGAFLELEAGGVHQVRYQSNGMHAIAQNHNRIHFGLGENEQADTIKISWPSGRIQKIKNIPADQVVEIHEPVTQLPIVGVPSYVPGEDEGVFLWKDEFSGYYQIRVVGGGTAMDYLVTVMATSPVTEVVPVELEPGDFENLDVYKYGFHLKAQVLNGEDGVTFKLPEGAEAFISVSENGKAYPRQLKVGSIRSPLKPSGWIIDSQNMGLLPKFQKGRDYGLHIGSRTTEADSNLVFIWTGDGRRHVGHFKLLSTEKIQTVEQVQIESNDVFTTGSNWVEVEGPFIGKGIDGIEVPMNRSGLFTVIMEFDGLLHSRRANTLRGGLGTHNAYKFQ